MREPIDFLLGSWYYPLKSQSCSVKVSPWYFTLLWRIEGQLFSKVSLILVVIIGVLFSIPAMDWVHGHYEIKVIVIRERDIARHSPVFDKSCKVRRCDLDDDDHVEETGVIS